MFFSQSIKLLFLPTSLNFQTLFSLVQELKKKMMVTSVCLNKVVNFHGFLICGHICKPIGLIIPKIYVNIWNWTTVSLLWVKLFPSNYFWRKLIGFEASFILKEILLGLIISWSNFLLIDLFLDKDFVNLRNYPDSNQFCFFI